MDEFVEWLPLTIATVLLLALTIWMVRQTSRWPKDSPYPTDPNEYVGHQIKNIDGLVADVLAYDPETKTVTISPWMKQRRWWSPMRLTDAIAKWLKAWLK